MSLDKTDIQKFFKRLRKIHNKKNGNIKYYCAGEYGTNRMRPHYHIILFNSKHEDVITAWTNPQTKKPIGEIHFGNVAEASIGYTLKYISKKGKIPVHANDDRQPEFSLMSKNWVRHISPTETYNGTQKT